MQLDTTMAFRRQMYAKVMKLYAEYAEAKANNEVNIEGLGAAFRLVLDQLNYGAELAPGAPSPQTAKLVADDE